MTPQLLTLGGEATGDPKYIVATMDSAVLKTHLELHPRTTAPPALARVLALCANVVAQHSNQFGRVKMIAEQSRRLETVEEPGSAASPSLKAEAFFQSRAASLSQVRKLEFCDLLETMYKTGGWYLRLHRLWEFACQTRAAVRRAANSA